MKKFKEELMYILVYYIFTNILFLVPQAEETKLKDRNIDIILNINIDMCSTFYILYFYLYFLKEGGRLSRFPPSTPLLLVLIYRPTYILNSKGKGVLGTYKMLKLK